MNRHWSATLSEGLEPSDSRPRMLKSRGHISVVFMGMVGWDEAREKNSRIILMKIGKNDIVSGSVTFRFMPENMCF